MLFLDSPDESLKPYKCQNKVRTYDEMVCKKFPSLTSLGPFLIHLLFQSHILWLATPYSNEPDNL